MDFVAPRERVFLIDAVAWLRRSEAGIIHFELLFSQALRCKVFLEDQFVVNEGASDDDSESDSFDQVHTYVQRLYLEIWISIGNQCYSDANYPDGCSFCYVQKWPCQSIEHFCYFESIEVVHADGSETQNHQDQQDHMVEELSVEY